MRLSAVLAGVCLASSVTAQDTFVRICINMYPEPGGVRNEIFARLFNPTGEVQAVIADLGFRVEGWDLSDFIYNPAFDSDFFGPASVDITSSEITFRGGNTLPPLNDPGGPDSSNPLPIAEFYGSIWSFSLEGQVNGAYVGTPFANVYTLQYAAGGPGDMPYEIRYCNFPSPGTASLLGIAVAFAARRRR